MIIAMTMKLSHCGPDGLDYYENSRLIFDKTRNIEQMSEWLILKIFRELQRSIQINVGFE